MPDPYSSAYSLDGLMARAELCGPADLVVTARGSLNRDEFDTFVRWLAGKQGGHRWHGGEWVPRVQRVTREW